MLRMSRSSKAQKEGIKGARKNDSPPTQESVGASITITNSLRSARQLVCRFAIPLKPPSSNDLRRKARSPRIAVLMVRREWRRHFRPDVVAYARRTLHGPRLVTFTRLMGPREREYDDDNLRGGLKPIRDLLCVGTPKHPGLGLLLDDRKETAQFEYVQIRGERPMTIIDIEELPCPG